MTAVKMTIGMNEIDSSARISARMSSPLTYGIIRSSSTMSGFSSRTDRHGGRRVGRRDEVSDSLRARATAAES